MQPPKAEQQAPTSSDVPSSWIGTAESGRGDYFGPLVIAGVLVTMETQKELSALGIGNADTLLHKSIYWLAGQIRQLCPHSIAVIDPPHYNALHDRMRSIFRILGSGHARVIEVILSNHSCEHAVVSNFGAAKHLRSALMDKGKRINILQPTHAKDDLAVAAASILARVAYLNSLRSLSSTYRFPLPKGAGRPAIEAGRRFVSQVGKANLKYVAKLHFSTSGYVLNPDSQFPPSPVPDTNIDEVLASLQEDESD